MAERSLESYPRGGAAIHSLAHVFYETDDHSSGRDFLGEWMAEYSRAAPQYCHLSWHRTLFELASGNYQRVLELYDHEIAPFVGRSRTGMYDAAALLWRWQIYGCGEARPWDPVVATARTATARPGMAFSDANAILALAAAGDEAAIASLIDGLRALDAKGHPTAGSVVLPLVQAVVAFVEGEYAETIRLLAPLVDSGDLVRVGGSNAQREVFEDTLLEAYLRAGEFDHAERLLRTRLNRRTSARDFFWLGRAQAGRGEREAARASLEQSRGHWSGADSSSAEIEALEQQRQALIG